MKYFLIKLFCIPFAAYFAMMLTVAILGSTIGNNELKTLTGGSGLSIWIGWIFVFFISVTAQDLYKNIKKH